jgi:hypothetical protein
LVPEKYQINNYRPVEPRSPSLIGNDAIPAVIITGIQHGHQMQGTNTATGYSRSSLGPGNERFDDVDSGLIDAQKDRRVPSDREVRGEDG